MKQNDMAAKSLIGILDKKNWIVGWRPTRTENMTALVENAQFIALSTSKNID